jgi:hypothetical protein
VTSALCMKCGSSELRPSRRRSWIEYAAALGGWRMRRCKDCNMRFLQCGSILVRTVHLKRLQRRILLAIVAASAMAAVLAAILYFGHAQASAASEGILLLQ